MSDTTTHAPGYAPYVNTLITCIRKDLVWIVAATLVMGCLGAAVGKLTNVARSSAQLVLTPFPLSPKARVIKEGVVKEDALEVLLATPLDVKATSLLCLSDEVLQKTMAQLNDGGQLSKPIKNLVQVKKALSFRVAVDKETPYDITYVPLLTLTAEATVPADAKLIVNTWAQVIAEAGRRYQEAVQGSVAKVMNERVDELEVGLTKAELDSEKFWTDNNIEYLQGRLNAITGDINNFKKERVLLQDEIVKEEGTAQAFEDGLARSEPKITLNWKSSPELAAVLGAKIGLDVPKKEKQEGAIPDFLTIEQVNQVYWEIHGKAATARATAAGKQKQLQELDRLIEGLEKERLEFQATFAKATTGKLRAGRSLLRMEDAFHDIALKREFAQVAGRLDNAPLQIISEGAEWPLPRFRRAIAFGGVAGVLGLLAAACASAGYRMVLKPVLGG